MPKFGKREINLLQTSDLLDRPAAVITWVLRQKVSWRKVRGMALVKGHCDFGLGDLVIKGHLWVAPSPAQTDRLTYPKDRRENLDWRKPVHWGFEWKDATSQLSEPDARQPI